MSIPGLGQLAAEPAASDNKTITLQPYWEWRFSVTRNASVTVRLLSGTANREGTELALNRAYKFSNTKSFIYTLQGCTLEITGSCENRVAEYATPEESPLLTYVNMHFALQEERRKVESNAARGAQGPRVMICGRENSGKTNLARMLVGWATRMGSQPLMANLDPNEGLLSLPGTLSAAVYGTLMDVEEPAGGFGIGSTPSSGPSAVPVKVPVVYYYGREKVEDDVAHWKDLTRKLASSVRAKLNKDKDVRASGAVIDAPSFGEGKEGLDLLQFAITEFSVNIVIVLGSPQLSEDLQRRLADEKTPLGEPIYVVPLERSDGVAERDGQFMRATRDAAIKEFFFGDAKRTLSPSTQSVGFDDVAIFKSPDESEAYEEQPVLEAADISAEMSHWTFAVMNASVNDPPETIRQAPVIGFIAIADVDEDRRRLKVLSPTSGRLGNQPLVWGRWPEPYINLLG
ncbi:Pre-mRNA cleavage complex II protein Clp1-domain-containing protein [Immersiella caudata]|uniref:Polynucleotide 5'-hydroxyl-kinase GRC3 n=1 Tax=Immersiella caudata TaxID=314043 RepID=A0AA39WRX8_9PEZI|nr:Pre-mRNA cleavage complex II protein Clp1-domain-containing protein [Immersiella caudata]